MSKKVLVKCKTCNKEWTKRKDALKKWSGLCGSCSSKLKIGVLNPFYGKKHSENTKYKISKHSKGRMTFLGKQHSKESKLKISISHIGKKLSKEHILNLSKSHKGILKGRKRTNLSKEKHPRWKGGISKLQENIRGLLEIKQWSRKVMERDNFTCNYCHKTGGKLSAHHIFQLSDIISALNLTEPEQILLFPFVLDITNGITVCESCHKYIHRYKIYPLS